MSIETYIGKEVQDLPYIPKLPRPICGVKFGEDAPAEQKGPLILFSGGLDSTYLVYETLKTSNVHLLYVVGNVYNEKVKQELLAREKIKQWFTDNPHSEYRIISDTVLRFEVGDVEQMFNGVISSQPAMWLYPALYYYKAGLHTSVQIAYVKDDSVIPRLNNLKEAWDNLTLVIKLSHVPLLFPITEVHKTYIFSTLPVELRQLIWVCDRPMIDGNRKTVECGKCGPCKRRFQYLNVGTYNET